MSNQVNISLDRRRVEQLARLAALEGKKIAQWIDDRVTDAWRVEFPDEPVPGVRVWNEESPDGSGRRVMISLFEKARDETGQLDSPPLAAVPDVAQRIAFGLRGVAEREVANFKIALDNDTRLHIRRQGTGVTIQTFIGDRKDGTWVAMPSMAVDVADCIARAAKEIS